MVQPGSDFAQQLPQPFGLPGDRTAVGRQPDAERSPSVISRGRYFTSFGMSTSRSQSCPLRPVAQRRHRQHDHVEALLPAQQVLDVVHDVLRARTRRCASPALRARERQHVAAGIDVHHRRTGLQCLRGDEAVAAEQIEHAQVLEVVAALDAPAHPGGAGYVAAAQTDMAARVQPAGTTSWPPTRAVHSRGSPLRVGSQ